MPSMDYARSMRPAGSDFLRPAANGRSGPPLPEASALGQIWIAAIDRQIPRPGKDRARLQSIEPPNRMTEMRRIGIADVLRQMREIDFFVDEMQQMARPLPGPESAERYSGLLLEEVQEPRWGQVDGGGVISRRQFAAGEIVEPGGGPGDAAVDIAVRQKLAEAQAVEILGREAGAPLLHAQIFVSRANALRELRAIRAVNSLA